MLGKFSVFRYFRKNREVLLRLTAYGQYSGQLLNALSFEPAWSVCLIYIATCMEWLWTGFGLVIGFNELLQNVTSCVDYTVLHILQITTAALMSFQLAMSWPVYCERLQTADIPLILGFRIDRVPQPQIISVDSPTNSQLYPQALDSLYVASCDSQSIRATEFEVRSYFTTDGQSVCLGIEHPCETCNQILLPVGMFLSEICGFVSVGRPHWREDVSAICSVITQWFGSIRPRNHTLLSHQTPPTWRTRFPYLYPPGTEWPSYTPRHWVPFTSSLTTRRATVEVF
jgi:hypothetical protein